MSNQSNVPAGFDPAVAIFMAKASAAVYDSPLGSLAAFRNQFKFEHPTSVTTIAINHKTDSLALTIEHDGNLYIIFRGTRSLKNLITDLDVEMVELDPPMYVTKRHGIKVHKGFWLALNSVWVELIQIIRSYIYNAAITPHTIILAGHSLGAAMAAECAAYIWNAFHVRSIGYTFGQPRVGNAKWRDFFHYCFPRWYRMIHCNDVVCRIPAMLRLYYQTEIEMFFDNADGLHVNWPWYKKLPSDIRGLCRHHWIDPDELLADHHVSTYVALLDGKWGKAA